MTTIPNYNKKIGRNEPCPCGSKKKYKRCHGDTETVPTLNHYQIDNHARTLIPASKCLVPPSLAHECSKGTINAHTVSRSGSLGAIEKDGHVYSYKPSLVSLVKSSGALRPELTGWKKASTFPGFCGTHDKKLFESLEDKVFTGSKEQCFLLAYRCIARELYTKQLSANQIKLRQALATKSSEKELYVADFNHGVELGLADSNTHKERYDAVLISKNWSEFRTVLIEFDGVFPIQCAGAFFPEIDIHGNEIQKIGFGKAVPDAISIVSFAADNKSYMLFGWLLDSDKSCSSFISVLLRAPELELPATIGSLILQRSENCHFSPNWYDKLDEQGKKWCAEQMLAGSSPFVSVPPPGKYGNISYFNGVKIKSIHPVS